VGVPHRQRRQAALAILAARDAQCTVPALDIGDLERLKRDLAEEGRDLIRAQLAVPFGGLGRDHAERLPSLDPLRDMPADRELRSRDMFALINGGDQLGEFGLRLPLRPSEAPILDHPLAGRALARIEFELE
jgi:hypothetical protein